MPLHDVSAPLAGVWTPDINESGASLANWTQTSGSWTVASSVFNVSTAAATQNRLQKTAQHRQVAVVYQADVQMKSTGGYGTDNRVGLLLNWLGSGNTGMFVALKCTGALTPSSTGLVYVEETQNVVAGGTVAYNFNLDQFYTITAFVIGGMLDAFVNGVYVGSWGGGTQSIEKNFFGLAAYNCQAAFKNIRSSALNFPLPI